MNLRPCPSDLVRIDQLLILFLDVSSELGIVSNAKRAWEISTKTNEHVNNVIQKQAILYILQNNNGQIEASIPQLKVEIEKEKKKLELIGTILLKN